MTPAARVQSAIEILDEVIASARRGGASADRIAAEWFRAHRFAGSKDQISRPVAAFSATAFMLCVVMYITPSTTIGLTCIVDRGVASPERYSQAGARRWTLAA